MSNPVVPTKSTGDQFSAGEVNSIVTSIGTKEDAVNKGVANGYAGLDGGAKVPAAQLPSYVDDVLEFANVAAFPSPGETGKIYVDLSTNPTNTYRWSGSAYIPIGGGGSLLTPTGVKTANYNALAGDFVPVNNAAGNLTVTLPAAPADKAQVGVKLVLQTGANTVIVNTAGSDVFNKAGGSTSLSLTLLNQGALFQYNASAGIWYVLADDLPLGLIQTRTTGTITNSTGAIVSGDQVEAALGKAQGQINAANAQISSIDPSVIGLPALGIIINDNFTRASLGSNWTNTGTATFSIVSNQLSVTNSGSSYSSGNYIAYTGYGNSGLEGFSIAATMIAGTINTTSFGLGFGMESNGAYIKNTVRCILRMDTANLGKIQFDGLYNGSQIATQTSLAGMAIATGDTIKLYFNFIKNKIIFSAYNVTQNVTNIAELDIQTSSSATFQIPNAFNYTIISAGGSQTLTSYVVTATDVKNVPFLYCGDSITKGNDASNLQNRRAEIVQNVANTITQTNAGGGNLIRDLNVAEILSLLPTKIVLMIGINNFQAGTQTQAQVQTEFNTLISALATGGYTVGINVFIGTLIPGPNYNLTASNAGIVFNTWLKTTWGASVIDYFTPQFGTTSVPFLSKYVAADGIHPNDAGQQIMADADINYFKLSPQAKKKGNVKPVYFNPNGNVQLGDSRGISNTPIYHLDIAAMGMTNLDATAQLHTGITGNDDGMYAGSLGSGQAFIGAGALRQTIAGVASILPKLSAMSVIDMGAGIAFYLRNGQVAGTPFLVSNTPDIYMSPATNTGVQARLGIGIGSSPGAFLDLNGGGFQNQIAGLRLRPSSGTYKPATFSGGEIYNVGNKLYSNMGTTAATEVQLDGQNSALVTKIANYTALFSDLTILVDATSGNITVTVNPALTNMLNIKKIDSTANTVTIVPSTGTIEGAASVVLSTQYAFKRVQGNGGSTVLVFS